MKRLAFAVAVALAAISAGQLRAAGFDFQAAYSAAAPGATILVPSGSYANVSIAGAKAGACDGYTIGGDTSGCVTFKPDVGATVSFTGTVALSASNLRMQGFQLGAVKIGDCAAGSPTSNVILQADSGYNLLIGNADHVGDLGGNWGPLHGNQVVYVNDCGNGKEANHVRFDGDRIHDAIQDTGSQHLECLHVEPGDYITVRNSVFTNCAQHDIAIGQGVGTHYLIENNTLASPCSQQSPPCAANDPIDASCAGGKSDWTVRFNSLNGAMIVSVNTGCSYGGTNAFYGNVENAAWFSDWQCQTFQSYGWTRSNNVNAIGASTCGSGNVLGATMTDPTSPAYNFQLAAGSPAIGLVPSTVARPSTDQAGNPRGTGTTDAGALLFQAPPPPPPPAYNPACAPTCDQQIAALKAQIAQALADAHKTVVDLGGS